MSPLPILTPPHHDQQRNSPQGGFQLSCESCRKRKIKCGRERPSCTLCLKSHIGCAYREARKPGPKLGSKQRSRKRARAGEATNTGTNDINTASRYDGLEMTGICETAPPETVNAANLTWLGQAADVRNNQDSEMSPYSTSSSPRARETFEHGVIYAESMNSPRSSMANMHDLSFIIHPTHEPTTDNDRNHCQDTSSIFNECAAVEKSLSLLSCACDALNISIERMNDLTDAYFSKMTSFSLFRQPHFRQKLSAISSLNQICALLASMFQFSAIFGTREEDHNMNGNYVGAQGFMPPPEHFEKLALRFLDIALEECADDKPSLCLLQALTLSTFQQLIKGARGRSWRSLGTCVRVAYELNLNLIDTKMIDHDMPFFDDDRDAWCLDEEKRRIWWAIWEMDTFASTVRRCPTAIDWSQNETRLPTDDGLWFRGEPHGSCFLDPNPIARWKVLQQCGSQSPRAWFIVVNSLMREAQQLSNPQAVYPFGSLRDRFRSKSNTAASFGRKSCQEISESLGVLENSLQCFTMALPETLRYHNEHLRFPPCNSSHAALMQNSSIYSIHIMIQLTKFMMYQHAVFGGGRREHCQAKASPEQTQSRSKTADSTQETGPDPEGLDRYIGAADDVLMIVSRSSGNQVKYVNPFLSSTIWLAAAVQLAYRFLGPRGSSKSLVNSKIELLRLNYGQFVDYWKVSVNPLINLDSLEKTLKHFFSSDNGPCINNNLAEANVVHQSMSSSSERTRHVNSDNRNFTVFDSDGSQWIDIFPVPDLQNLATNDQGSVTSTSPRYNHTMGFDQLAVEIEAARLKDNTTYSSINQTFDGFGFDLDMGTQSDLPGCLNGFFSSAVMG